MSVALPATVHLDSFSKFLRCLIAGWSAALRTLGRRLRDGGAWPLILALCIAALSFPGQAQATTASYLYKLSDFNGTIPFSWVRMYADPRRREIYVTDEDSAVRVFNDTGMEIYRFNEDRSLGNIRFAVVDAQGDILILTYAVSPRGKYSVIRCNYRGDVKNILRLKNVPAEFLEGFSPDTLAYRPGHLYIADKSSFKVLVTDEQGTYEKGIDLFSFFTIPQNKRQDYELMGFSVDAEGDILFTIPVMFRAFKLSPEGKLIGFGERGGAPGKFNIAAGIVSDDKGRYYVADRLKCVVMIFDSNFNFLDQVGYRGFAAANLIVPSEMAVLDDKLYVTQAAGRGVSVFSIKN